MNRPLYDAAAAVHEAAMRWGKHGLSSQAIRGATVNGIITRGEADSLERLIFDAFGQPAWVPCPGAHGKGCALHAMMEILCTEGP